VKARKYIGSEEILTAFIVRKDQVYGSNDPKRKQEVIKFSLDCCT
jgi:hypothetical protein